MVSALLLSVWLAVVIFTTIRHEYWRDEVRPWSLVRDANAPLDLFRLIRYEGHPILWYLLLYLGQSIVGPRLVLPITSLVIAGAAVGVFMFRSPFPLWMKALFLFSGLPLYEYSVMARNYGISMLLLFVVAALYCHRAKYWLPLAIALALLANTNIHATILTCLLLAIWGWDEFRARRVAPHQAVGRPFLAVVAIVGLGVLLSVALVNPPRDTVLTGFYATPASEFVVGFLGAVWSPGAGFSELFPTSVPVLIGSVVLYLAVVGLLRRPTLLLAALGGLVAFGMLFRLAYSGSYRHAGVFLCFLMCLYWIAAETPEGEAALKRRLFNAGLYVAVLGLLLASVYHARAVPADIRSPMSSSKAFGAFLSASSDFHDAILVPEPDYYLESIPFYVRNAIYFPREHRFGTTVAWSTAASADLSLGQLVSLARSLRAQYGRPVLVVLGHRRAVTDATGDIQYRYNRHFTWTASDRDDADRSLTPVAKFVSALGDEKYWVYAVK